MLYWNRDVDGGVLFAGGKLHVLKSRVDVHNLLESDEPDEFVSIEELCRLSDGALAQNILIKKDRVGWSVTRHANKVCRHKRGCMCMCCTDIIARIWRSVRD